MCLHGQGMELQRNCPDREGDNRCIIFVRLRGRSCQVGGGGQGAEEVWRSQCDLKALGARGQLPSGSMLSIWRVLKQFAQLLPSG